MESKMKSAEIPSKCLKDPRFVKILTASLCSQIAEGKKMLVDMDGDIQELKKKVEAGLERRKVLKLISKDLRQKKTMQEGALESLTRDGKKRSIELETMTKGLDDTTLRQKADRAKYEKILEDYELMWQQYKAEYEEFPLAKEREESRITVKKLEIQLMIIEYKRDELINMMKQRKIIDAMRIREAGIAIARLVLQRWEDEKYLENLQKLGAELQDELKAYDRELQEKIERSKLDEIETAEMPPPRLNFSFMRPVYSTPRNVRNNRRCDPSSPSRDSDTMSVNTVILERMCKDDTNYQEQREMQNSGKVYQPSQIKSVDEIPSMIQEVSDPKNTPEPMNIVESNIKDKIGKLRIEKKKLPRIETAKYNEGNEDRNRMEDGAGGVERKNHQLDPREAFQRTRRWCEESCKKVPSYDPEERKLNSANDSKQMETNGDEFQSDGGDMPKALSIHESEASYMNSSRWSFHNETGNHRIDNTAQQNWCENEQPKNLSQGSILGKRRVIRPTQNLEPAVSMNNNDEGYDESEKTNNQASPRSDETLETPIIPTANRPRITSVEKVNFPIGQRPTMGVNADPFANFGSSRNYAPSYASSGNLSVIESVQHLKTPQGTFMNEYGDIPLSPLNSEMFNLPRGVSVSSFTSTLADQQPNANNAINQPTEKQNPAPSMNFAGFMFNNKKPTKHSMF